MVSGTKNRTKTFFGGSTVQLFEDTAAAALYNATQIESFRLFRGKLDMDERGYLVTRPRTTETNVAVVFAVKPVWLAEYRSTPSGM